MSVFNIELVLYLFHFNELEKIKTFLIYMYTAHVHKLNIPLRVKSLYLSHGEVPVKSAIVFEKRGKQTH